MIPPEPTRIAFVPPAICPITTAVAALAIPGMFVAEFFRMLCKIERIAQRVRDRAAFRNGAQIQNRKGNHERLSAPHARIRCSPCPLVTAEEMCDLRYTDCLHGVFCYAHARRNSPPNPRQAMFLRGQFLPTLEKLHGPKVPAKFLHYRAH